MFFTYVFDFVSVLIPVTTFFNSNLKGRESCVSFFWRFPEDVRTFPKISEDVLTKCFPVPQIQMQTKKFERTEKNNSSGVSFLIESSQQLETESTVRNEDSSIRELGNLLSLNKTEKRS